MDTKRRDETDSVEFFVLNKQTKVKISIGLLLSILAFGSWLSSMHMTGQANAREVKKISQRFDIAEHRRHITEVFLARQDERWKALQEQLKKIERIMRDDRAKK